MPSPSTRRAASPSRAGGATRRWLVGDPFMTIGRATCDAGAIIGSISKGRACAERSAELIDSLPALDSLRVLKLGVKGGVYNT